MGINEIKSMLLFSSPFIVVLFVVISLKLGIKQAMYMIPLLAFGLVFGIGISKWLIFCAEYFR